MSESTENKKPSKEKHPKPSFQDPKAQRFQKEKRTHVQPKPFRSGGRGR